MALFDYIRTRETATRLIERFGQTATLRKPLLTGSDYDPTEGPPRNTTVNIVVTNYSNSEVNSGRIKRTDKKVLLAVGDADPTPTLEDKLTFDGVTHFIVGPGEGNGIIPLAPAGIVVMYELHCRHG